jgi:hypothetical protein
MGRSVKPGALVIRCFAEALSDAQQWQAFTLELGLAAQADSFGEARAKLEAMITDYLDDALGGQDKEHAWSLLRRKASPSIFARYYVGFALSALASLMHRPKSREVRIFREPWNVAPRHCAG